MLAANDPPRTRTWNLRLRRPTPYPLGQRAILMPCTLSWLVMFCRRVGDHWVAKAVPSCRGVFCILNLFGALVNHRAICPRRRNEAMFFYVHKRAHRDLDQGPADLRSAALTTELCTQLQSILVHVHDGQRLMPFLRDSFCIPCTWGWLRHLAVLMPHPSKCISRESNPGHIDGNDVFYH